MAVAKLQSDCLRGPDATGGCELLLIGLETAYLQQAELSARRVRRLTSAATLWWRCLRWGLRLVRVWLGIALRRGPG